MQDLALPDHGQVGAHAGEGRSAGVDRRRRAHPYHLHPLVAGLPAHRLAGCAHRRRAGIRSRELCDSGADATHRTISSAGRTRPRTRGDPKVADVQRDAGSLAETLTDASASPLAERPRARCHVHPITRGSTHAGTGADLVADAHPDTVTDTGPHTDTHPDTHTHTHTHTHGHADADAGPDSHTDPHADAETEGALVVPDLADVATPTAATRMGLRCLAIRHQCLAAELEALDVELARITAEAARELCRIRCLGSFLGG